MSTISVKVDLSDVLEEIDTDDLVAELEERADLNDRVAMVALKIRTGDDDDLLGDLTEYERDELRKAVALDDGSRALELLRRAL